MRRTEAHQTLVEDNDLERIVVEPVTWGMGKEKSMFEHYYDTIHFSKGIDSFSSFQLVHRQIPCKAVTSN